MVILWQYKYVFWEGKTMAAATLSVKMDPEVKKGLEDFCAAVGMNVSTAVNMFARAVVRDQRLPFEVTTRPADPFWSEANMARLTSAAARMDATGGTVHELADDDD